MYFAHSEEVQTASSNWNGAMTALLVTVVLGLVVVLLLLLLQKLAYWDLSKIKTNTEIKSGIKGGK